MTISGTVTANPVENPAASRLGFQDAAA